MILSERGQQLIAKYQAVYNGEQFYDKDTLVTDKGTIFDGFSMYKHLWKHIQQVTSQLPSFTFLDYGCGRAKHLYARVLPDQKSFHEVFKGKCQCYYCYDAANPLYLRKPPTAMKFDIIVCADVMEHIAEEDVGAVIKDIASYAHDTSVIMFSICGAPAMKSFVEEKENFHATLKDRSWWKDQIAKHFDIQRTVLEYH